MPSFEKKAMSITPESGRRPINKKDRQQPEIFDEDLLHDDKSEIISLNPDVEFVTAASALKYIIARSNQLHAQILALEKGGSAQKKKLIQEKEKELEGLGSFHKKINETINTPEAVVRMNEEDADVLVENPLYGTTIETLQAKTELKKPETPKTEVRDDFSRDAQGRIFGLRADEQFVTTDTAYRFIRAKTARLQEDLFRIEKSSLTKAEKERRRERIDTEIERLMNFNDAVDKASRTPEAVTRRRGEDAQTLVENPYFKEAETRRYIGKKLDRILQADKDSIDVTFDEDTNADGSIDVELEDQEQPIDPLVRGKDGHIVSLRGDAPTLTLREANLFLADRFAAVKQEMSIINESHLSSKAKKEALKKIDEEAAELRAFSRAIEDAEKSSANKERRYAGIEVRVENPYYNAEIAVSEDELTDTGEAKDPLHEKYQELQSLYRQRDLLFKERDLIVHGLRSGGPTLNRIAEQKRNLAEHLYQQPQYPQIFAPDNDVEISRQRLLREASATDELTRFANQRKQGPVIRREYVDLQKRLYQLEQEATQLERQRTYPETETGADRRRRAAQLREEAAAIRAEIEPGKFPNIGEALRTILEQIDTLQERITDTEGDYRFLQKRSAHQARNDQAA